jgi:mRNA-degrading endonuclease toxin of MazEF toxin-antitoxin module
MVDFGNPIGTEIGMEHPAVVVSIQEINNAATVTGRVIIVPATSTRVTNAQGKLLTIHHEVPASGSNGLAHTTYFLSEQVRAASIVRFRRKMGVMEQGHLKDLENKLCLVMGLFT